VDEIYAELHELVRERLENWPARREGYHWPGYTYDHTLRVVNLATQMARQVGADVEVVRFAALLHDIRKDAGREHAELGAAEVRTLLPRYHLPVDFVEAIASAIECHAGSNTPQHPLESLILGDADLIDANFGLVATWRFITIRSGRGEELAGTILAMDEWLPQKDALAELLNTDLGREIAAVRSKQMRDFCGNLKVALINAHNESGKDARPTGNCCGGYGEPGLLWLAEYIHSNADTGRLHEQLGLLDGGGADGIQVPAAAEPSVRTLAAEVAGDQ